MKQSQDKIKLLFPFEVNQFGSMLDPKKQKWLDITINVLVYCVQVFEFFLFLTFQTVQSVVRLPEWGCDLQYILGNHILGSLSVFLLNKAVL